MRNQKDPRNAGNVWRSISSIFRRSQRRGMQAELRMAEAYQAVFFGNPSREDQAIVLADMLNKSGFQKFTPAHGVTDQELWQAEGMRRLYAETIFARVRLPEAEMRALEEAARIEAAVDADPIEKRNT